MARTNEVGNLILLECPDARASALTIHIHSADHSIAYLNALSPGGFARPLALDPATARRVAEVLVGWADQREGGR